ncbi:MAG: HEAT repeat domain-containing protein [Planctomycetota bacterium]|jgi:HEAT repeat protein
MMRCSALILLLGLAGQDVPTKRDAERAVEAYKEAIKDPWAPKRVEAARVALQTHHEKVIRAVGDALLHDTEQVKKGVAGQLGHVDHPVSVDVLAASIEANREAPEVLKLIAQSLGRLKWEKGAKPLHALLKRHGEEHIRKILPQVISALGVIGSASSVDPLIDFLRVTEGRKPWPEINDLKHRTDLALRSITSGDRKEAKDWVKWWRKNRKELQANARVVYWSKKTHKRTELGRKDKAPKDSLQAAVLLRAKPKDDGEGGWSDKLKKEAREAGKRKK